MVNITYYSLWLVLYVYNTKRKRVKYTHVQLRKCAVRFTAGGGGGALVYSRISMVGTRCVMRASIKYNIYIVERESSYTTPLNEMYIADTQCERQNYYMIWQQQRVTFVRIFVDKGNKIKSIHFLNVICIISFSLMSYQNKGSLSEYQFSQIERIKKRRTTLCYLLHS